MLFLLSFCCSVLSCLSFSSLYTSADLNTYSTDSYLSLSFNNLRLYLAHSPLFTALGSSGIAPFCVHTYALTCTARR